MNNLVLIDGNSLINRAFYATPPLSAKDGTPTNAVYAFVNMLVKLIGKFILINFVLPEKTFLSMPITPFGTVKNLAEPR